MAVHESWETVKIMSKGLEGKNKGRWGYNYARRIESKFKGQEAASDGIRDGFIDQEKGDWGVLRGEDQHLHLKSSSGTVKVPSGERERWRITSTRDKCCGKYILAYKEEARFLKEQLLFRCRHSEIVLGLEQERCRRLEDGARRVCSAAQVQQANEAPQSHQMESRT